MELKIMVVGEKKPSGHPEIILLAMITDSRSQVKEMAIGKVKYHKKIYMDLYEFLKY